MTSAATRDTHHQAAEAALRRQLRLAQQGRSMLYPFIGRSAQFQVWQHYPRHDAISASGRWQFYFHAHDPAEPDSARHAAEHGHIHLFRRSTQGRLTHLAGLALDARGIPLCWFTTNQWVTGEDWQPADALADALDDEAGLRLRGPLAGAALWLDDLLRFYDRPLRRMLQQRDQALARHCRDHAQTREQAWADRRVAVWSSVPVQWPDDALRATGPSFSLH